MNGKDHQVIDGEYDIKEKVKDLVCYFNNLKLKGLRPKSATIDGNPAVIEALRMAWPTIIIQRCLVHIQRQGLSWCRRSPKRTDAKHLRKLFLAVTEIKTKQDAEKFLLTLRSWEEKYGKELRNSRTGGWVVSDLVKARSMLLKALPDMFQFLTDPKIPNTTNGVEGYFSRLKDKYRKHRGLSKERRNNYFKWYLYLVKH